MFDKIFILVVRALISMSWVSLVVAMNIKNPEFLSDAGSAILAIGGAVFFWILGGASLDRRP